jgi:hypothetical protein
MIFFVDFFLTPDRYTAAFSQAFTTCSLTFNTESNPLLSVYSPCGIYSLPPVLIQLVVFTLRISLQTPADSGSSLADFSTLKMEAIPSSETSVYASSTQRHIPEYDIVKKITGLHNEKISCKRKRRLYI